jgi:hypothetical protein
VIVVATILLGADVCVAQSADVEEDGWEFSVTPYLFAAGLDGKVGIKDVATTVYVPFDEILDHLDAGFMMAVTARHGRWVLGLDGIYVKLSGMGSKSVSGPFGNITLEGTVEAALTEQIYQPTIAYRVFGGDAPTLDVYVAVRYTGLETELTLASTTTLPSFPDGSRQMNADVSWWDPVIGKRVIIHITDKFFGTTLVDFGGFGVGSDVTYQWLVTGGWRFSHAISASVGYRYLKQDYEDDDFLYNMVMKGVVIGVGVTF